VTLVAEIGDFARFARPCELMGFLGVVPSEYSSGNTRRQGAITKTGNSHARRVLIEAAWNYRFPARLSAALQKRQQDQPKAVREIAWRAQLRLAKRYRHLGARKLALNKICVAIARELSGFAWDIARQVKPLPPKCPPYAILPSVPGGEPVQLPIVTTELTTHGSRRCASTDEGESSKELCGHPRDDPRH